ncbi:Hsp70 family protein [Streptomyces chrestomyceticus]|uniref:Hsp70 family protein n=1 Tax=Streptomyces chrestomyceticus TaxID=68185 RepID=UPI0035A8321A
MSPRSSATPHEGKNSDGEVEESEETDGGEESEEADGQSRDAQGDSPVGGVIAEKLSGCRLAERLTTEIIRQLRKTVLLQITASGYSEEDVRWGITVPMMFNDEERRRVRRAAIAAGISAEDGRLVLALEPEAAAHHARIASVLVPGADGSVREDLTAPGRQIIILDSGGGTADLTAYENDHEGRMIEIGKGNGAQLGSNEINRRFEDRLLVDRFGKPELVAELRAEEPEAMLDLMEAWERAKLYFKPGSTETITLIIPAAIDRRLGATVRKRIARKQRGRTDAILVTPQEAQELFDTVVPDILDLVDEQLAEVAKHNEATAGKPAVVLAGGFTNSPYLQQALKEHIGDRATVVVPPDPGVAVLAGALHFVHNPQIRARRSRFTYGVSSSSEFDPARDPKEYRYVTSVGDVLCKNRFSKLVTIGDLVDTDKDAAGYYLPIEGDQDKLRLGLYTSTEENPRYVSDAGCCRIGEITVDLTPVNRLAIEDRGVSVYLHFGETEIRARAVVDKSGAAVSTTLDFATDY